MEYRIKSIKHSGRKGIRMTDRTDGRYPDRVGRVVEFEPTEYEVGFPFILKYLRLSDGSDYSGMWLQCSRLVKISSTYDDDVVLAETLNTIYEFEKCK